MVVVGITQRVDEISCYGEIRDALDQRLIDWVIDTGFIPVPIPNDLFDLNLSVNSQITINKWLDTLNVEALLLSGGNDIGEFKQRDMTEKYLLLWAEKNHKPVLGICRGMQMIGVHAGSKLIEVDGHVKTRHQLQLKNSYEKIFPESVNSYHNLALNSCPNLFQILAEAEDGGLEAMRHKELPWEAWMWHPEREDKFSIIDQQNFKNLIDYER